MSKTDTDTDNALGGLFADVPDFSAPQRRRPRAAVSPAAPTVTTRNPVAARAAADAGIEKVEENADPAFIEAADRAAEIAASRKAFLTTDDLWEVLGELGMADATHNNSAIGPVMMRAKRKGLIEFANRYQKSERESRHCNQLRVWKSLVFDGSEVSGQRI